MENGTNGNDADRRQESRRRSNENLRPAPQWSKGQSGNPKGRPKGKSLSAEIQTVLAGNSIAGKPVPQGLTVRQYLAQVFASKAARGDFRFAKEIIDRDDGKVVLKYLGPDHIEEMTVAEGLDQISAAQLIDFIYTIVARALDRFPEAKIAVCAELGRIDMKSPNGTDDNTMDANLTEGYGHAFPTAPTTALPTDEGFHFSLDEDLNQNDDEDEDDDE